MKQPDINIKKLTINIKKVLTFLWCPANIYLTINVKNLIFGGFEDGKVNGYIKKTRYFF